MRISMDCRYIRERPSGIGTYVQALLDRLPELDPSASFQLWTHPAARGTLATRPGLSEVVVRAGANSPATLFWPARLVDLRGIDVLFAPFNLLGHGLHLPTVVTIHDLMWLLTPEACEGRSFLTPVQALFYRDGILRALRRATRLVAISRATADAIALVAPDALPKTRVIYHGVEPRFRPSSNRDALRNRLLARHQIEEYFLVVGQNAPSKNHGAILRAFAAARLDPKVHLVLVQRLYARRGPLLARGVPLDEQARALGVGERVRFLSGLSGEEMVELIQGALALVQYSRFEGFGMPALEAMACGTPVIASNIPPLVEVLGGAGLHATLEPSSLVAALEQVASSASFREELRGRSLERARAFSWDRCAREHLEVLREAAGASPCATVRKSWRGRTVRG
ncbi:MAG: glycosyltransferase family 1 protein [Myxococcales bacterium]|nr:glycosyltransferase family 4 protein [Polyangiaceae bacterium]MDW8251225.1 glycosyltransferase family 1 protein [Myxococcales bacterium]